MKKVFIIICSSLVWGICFAWIATFRNGCGYTNPVGIGFRFIAERNNEADFGKFPWTAAIMGMKKYENEASYIYICGGTIIGPKAVLTAAHCLRKDLEYEVRGGEWDFSNEFEQLAHQDRKIKKSVFYSKYNHSFDYDIAILVLETPFEFDDHIQPICLPDNTVNFEYSNCFKTGWGSPSRGSELTNIMKEVHFNVISQSECDEVLKIVAPIDNLGLTQFCARNKNDDICAGSSGSPLVCPIPFAQNRYYLAGIIAFGFDCGGKDVFTIFTNVSYYRDWIDYILEVFDVSPESYTYVN